MFYIAQAGTALKAIQSDGTVVALTIPSSVTISASRPGRFAALAQQLLFVNGPTVNLWIDPFDLTVRPMSILPPISAPTLAAGSGTGLTGIYRAAVAYYVKNPSGAIVNLSPIGPLSIPTSSLANKNLSWTNIPVCPNATDFVSLTSDYLFGRRLYRTLAGGTDLFQMIDLDDNSTTSIDNGLVDSTLSLLTAEPGLGTPPGGIPGTGMGLLTEYKRRLWGVSSRFDELDTLRYTEVNQFYGWAAGNAIPAYPVGADKFGITGLLRRRDVLGVCKRDRLLKLIGSAPEDFELITVSEGVSFVSAATCLVVRDVGYGLGLDGFYKWDDSGVDNVSRGSVDPWFTTDTYFNRSRFQNAFAGWNPIENTIELHLAAAGSNVEDRWVSYQIDKGEWLGPHKTGAFTPASCPVTPLESASDALLTAVGGTDGYIYLANQTVPSDIPGGGAAGAIDAFFEPRWQHNDAPDIEHYFGRLSVLSRIESGGTLTVTPYVGGLGAAAGTAQSFDLTLGRQIKDRIGTGRLCKLKFALNTVARRFLIYGYEFDNVFELGRR